MTRFPFPRKRHDRGKSRAIQACNTLHRSLGFNPRKTRPPGLRWRLRSSRKKVPLRRSPPPISFALAIEIDRKRGDQIELSTEIGQRLVGPDRPDPPFDLEQIEQLREEGKLVDIQAQRRVSQVLKNKEEEPATAPEVEHRPRRSSGAISDPARGQCSGAATASHQHIWRSARSMRHNAAGARPASPGRSWHRSGASGTG